MRQRIQRILIILLGIAAIIYTLVNYNAGRSELSTSVVAVVFLGWILFSQVRALIREWGEN